MGDLGAIWDILNPWKTGQKIGQALRPVAQKGKEAIGNLPPVKAIREAGEAVGETTAGVSGIIGDIGNTIQNVAKIAIWGGVLLLGWQLLKPTGLVGRELPYGRKATGRIV